MSVHHVKNKPYIIGLTGGIASGKSTASAYFKSKGIEVIDSDLIVKDLWKENEEMIQKAESLFGFKINTIQDKKKVSQLIFTDKKLRIKLNDIVHPYVFHQIEQMIKTFNDQELIVIDMPLLFEVGYEKKCDITCLVYVDLKTQVERLAKRDDITEEKALTKIKAQMDLEEKKVKADIILDNQMDLNFLYFQIDQFLRGIKHAK
jgi:dephospho-CoA kinase